MRRPRFLRTWARVFWIIVCVALCVSARAGVIEFDPSVSASAIERSFPAMPGERIGNVQIVEYGGPYMGGDNATPEDGAVRRAIANAFYQVQPDDYDFLLVFGDFPIDFGRFAGFHVQVANHVEGLGRPLSNGSAAFGSEGRLLGYIDMADALRLPTAPNERGHQQILDTLMHEIMHQWGVYVRYRDDAGQVSSVLLGHQQTHWSFFADTDASLMYGARWQPQGSNRFRAIGVRERFSPLDLYLAGFLAAEQVPPIRLIRSFQGDPADMPRLGVMAEGQADSIRLDQIIAHEGMRSPSSVDAQRAYRAALVLMVRPGQPPRSEMLARLEMLRMQAQTRFAALTLGQGILNIGPRRPEPVAVAGAPETVGSDLPMRMQPDMALAVEWLLSRQFADGHWQDKPATRLVDTVLVAGALRSNVSADPALVAAGDWLRSARRSTIEEQSHLLQSRLLTVDDAALIAAEIADAYVLDRGWGLNGGFEASTLDTAAAVDALFSQRAQYLSDIPEATLANWRDAIPAQVRGDCWTLHAGDGRCHPLASARALRALGATGMTYDQMQPAVERLYAWQNPDGGFGEGASSEAETVEMLLALNAIGAPRDNRFQLAELYIASRQRSDGSWQGSVATTAKVMIALSLAQRADLRLRSAIVETEAVTYPGDRVGLRLSVDNGGAVAAMPSRLLVSYVSERDPQVSGVLDDLSMLPALAPLQREQLVGYWQTAGLPPGTYRLDIALDADDEIDEVDEGNNRADLRVNLASPPALADLDIEPGTAALSPNMVTQVPAAVSLNAVIRNRGSTPVSQVKVRASLIRGTQAIRLAETVLADVGAMSMHPVEMALSVAHIDASEVLLEVDPDGAIAEADESNNSHRMRLFREATVDLAVSNSDIVLANPAPVVGVDVPVAITLRNRGTEIAPPSRFLVESEHDGSRQVIVDQTVQLPANAARELVISWRPHRPGQHRLHVTLDPDDVVPEIDEANNAAWLDVDIVSSSLPNLIVSSVDLVVTPDPPEQGRPLVVDALIQNAGTVDAGPFVVGMYLGDPAQGGERFALLDLPAGLAAGETYPAQAVIVSLERTREIVVAVRVDDHDQVPESSEADNVAMQVRPVMQLPDLAVREGDVRLEPARPVPGEINRVHVRVINNGQQPVADALIDIHLGMPGQGGVELAPSHVVPWVPQGGSAEHVFEWLPTGLELDSRIVVRVDPHAAIRESNEDNNQAVVDFDVLDTSFFVTEPVFSPNGDGVKDSTRIVGRFDVPTSVVIRIETEWGKEVRRFEGASLTHTLAFTLDWDGLDETGQRVLDADYRVYMESSDGVLLRTLDVAVDTNRLPVLLSAATAYEHVTPLSCAGIRQFGDVIHHPDGQTYFAVGTDDEDGQRRAIHLFDMDGGAPRAIVAFDSVWQDGERWSPIDLVDLVGTHLYYRATSVGTPEQARLFRVPIHGGSSVALGPRSHVNEHMRVLGLNSAGDVIRTRWVSSGALHHVEALRAPAYVSADVISGEWRVDHPLDGNHLFTEQFLLIRAGDEDEWADPPHWLKIDLTGQQPPSVVAAAGELWAIDAERGVLYSGSPAQPDTPASLSKVDLADGTGSSLPVPGDGERIAVTLNPGSGELFLFDAKALQVHRLDPALGAWRAADISLPLRALFGAAAGTVGHERVGSFQWSSGGQLVLFEFSSGMEFLTAPDVLTKAGVPTGATNATLALWSDLSEPPALIRSNAQGLHGPLLDVRLVEEVNQLSHQGIQATLLPGEPQFLFGVSTMDAGSANYGALPMRAGVGGRVANGRDYGIDSWNAAGTRLLAQRIANSTTPCDQAGYFSIQSLMNLTAQLRVEYSGVLRALALQVTASDMNFDRYEIEFRSAVAGSSWQPVLAGGDVVIDEVVGFWAPPAPGAYEIRLSSYDWAGNIVRKQVPVLWFDEARLGTVRLTEKYFSPNNDGVLDTTAVSFSVYLPVEVDVRVESQSGAVVRRDVLQFASVPDGPQAWVWDGRNDQGRVVADGPYRIVVDGRVLDVILDNTPPTVRFSASSFRPAGATAVLTAFIEDPLLSAQAIERAPTAQPDSWTLHDRFYLRRYADSRCFRTETRVDDCLRPLTYESAKAFRWRVIASDRAGNVAIAPLNVSPEAILGGELTYVPSHSQSEPYRVTVSSSFSFPVTSELDAWRAEIEKIYPIDSSHVAYLVADTSAYGNQPISLVYAERGDVRGCDGLHGLLWRPLPFSEVSRDEALSTLPSSMHGVIQAELPLRRMILVDESHFKDRTDYLIQLLGPGDSPGASCEVRPIRKVVFKTDRLVAQSAGYWASLPGTAGSSSVRAFLEEARLQAGTGLDLQLWSLFADASWQLLDASLEWTYCNEDAASTDILRASARSVVNGVMAFDANTANYGALGYASSYMSPRFSLRARHRSSGEVVQYTPGPLECEMISSQSDCETTGATFVKMRDRAIPKIPGSHEYRVMLLDESGSPVGTLASGYLSPSQEFPVSIAELEMGRHRIGVDRRSGVVWHRVKDDVLTVDRNPPDILQSMIDVPAGQTVCASEGGLPFSASASAVDDHILQSMELHGGPGPASCSISGKFGTCMHGGPTGWAGADGKVTLQWAAMDCELTAFGPPSSFTLDGFARYHDPRVNEEIDFDFLDGRTDRADLPGNRPYPFFSVSTELDLSAAFSLSSWERVDVVVDVVPAKGSMVPRLPSPLWEAEGEPVATLASGSSQLGHSNWSWGGLGQHGQPVADGVYGLRVRMRDDCGNSSMCQTAASDGACNFRREQLLLPIRVDNSPPGLSVSSPQNDVIVDIMHPISGRVFDVNQGWLRVHVRKAVADEPWQPLGGEHVIDHWLDPGEDAVWAIWNTVDLEPGQYEVRVEAKDRLGHVSERIIPVQVPARQPVLVDASVQPSLFSPNGDGLMDAVALTATLVHQGELTINVYRRSDGSLVRSIVAGQQATAGTHHHVWDGRSDHGVIVPDGAYALHIVVSDLADPGNVQRAILAVEVDTTVPAVGVHSPVPAFAKGDELLSLMIEERNPKLYQAQLRPQVGVGIWSGEGAGIKPLVDLSGAAEGEYHLAVQAVDRAENTSTNQFAFTIDRTPPDVELSSPGADAHVGVVGRTVAIRGRVEEAHLAGYRLQLLPEAGGAAIVLFQTDVAPADEHLFDWLPSQPDGRYLLQLIANDKAGWESVAQRVIVIDNTSPQVAIHAPEDQAFVSAPVRVEGSALDANLRRYRVELSPDAETLHWTVLHEASEPVEDDLLAELTALPAEGRFRLRVSAIDQAGNRAEQVVALSIDSVPPDAPLQLTAERLGTDGARLRWRAVHAPDLAGYRLHRDGLPLAEVAPGVTQYDDLVIPDGERVYTVMAYDHAGNASAHSNEARLRLDATGPDAQLLRPSDGDRVRADVEIWGTAYSDGDFSRFHINAVPAGAGSVQLAQGTLPMRNERLVVWDTRSIDQETLVRIELHAEDTSGNVSTDSVEVLVDNQPPAPPVGLTASVENAVDVRLGWTPNVEADLVGYLVYRGGQLLNGDPLSDPRDVAVAEVTWLDAGVADGAHAYRVVAVDLAGNISDPSDPASVAFEGQPPSVVFERPAEGQAFEHSVLIRVRTEHQDVTQVLFEHRASGDDDWVAIGAPISTVPYQTTFTPGALPYGDYQIRATATDSENLVDPSPPVRLVRYRDLTPPEAVTELSAQVDGGDVQLGWQMATTDDVAGFRIARRSAGGGDSEVIADLAASDVAFLDVDLDDGGYDYTVFAVDGSGNLSAGRMVSVLVHTPVAAYPYTPNEEALVSVCGAAIVVGAVQVQREVDGDAQMLDGATTDSSGAFCVESLALLPGTNHIQLRVLDADGHRSKPAELVLRHGSRPVSPDGLVVGVDGYQATLAWQVNPEPDVIGYRVVRDGVPLLADADTPEAGVGYYGYGDDAAGYPANALFDGDPGTFEWFHLDAATSVWIEQTYADPLLVAGIDVDLQPEPGRPWQPVNVVLQGWSGEAWITLDERQALLAGTLSLRPARAYRSDSVKVIVSVVDLPVSLYAHDIRVVERPLLVNTPWIETLPDGTHRYQVSAVNAYGFESDRSAVIEARVGDWQPPEPVVLSAQVHGASVHLSWTASMSGDVQAYLLMRGDSLLAAVPAGDPLSHVDAGLANGTYRYHVLVRDLAGHVSEPSNVVEAIIGQDVLVTAPTGLVAAAVEGGGALDLSWQAGMGPLPSGYRVLRSDSAAGPYQIVSTVEAAAHRDTGLINGRRYHYVVRAIDASGNPGPESNRASGVPSVTAVPATTHLLHPGQGGQVVALQGNATVVSGWAEPGAEVTILRDGQSVAMAQATVHAEGEVVMESGYGLISPDGRHVLHFTSDDRVELTRRGESAVLADFRWCGAVAWIDAESLLMCENGTTDTQVLRYSLVTQQRTPLLSMQSLQIASLSPDRRTIIVGGSRQLDGNWSDGIWLVDLGTGTWTQVDASALDSPYLSPTTWSADSRRFAFVSYEGEVALGDIETASVMPLEIIGDGDAAFLHDQSALLVAGDIGEGAGIHRVDLDSLAIERVPLDAGIQTRVVLSADGSRLLYLQDAVELVIRHWPSLAVVERRPLADSEIWPIWLGNGQIQLSQSMGEMLVTPSGLFLTNAVPLHVGSNRLAAYAQPQGSAGSLSSAVTVVVPSPHRPDLAVLAGDLRVVPSVVPVGGTAQMLARVRNLGTVPSPSSQLRVVIHDPGGQVVQVLERDVPTIPAGSSTELTVVVPVTVQHGEYRILVTADPANLIVEVNENNNQAIATLLVARDDQPELAVDLSHSSLAPGMRLTGSATAIAVSTPFHGRMAVRVLDAQGYLVADLGQITVQLPAPGERVTLPVDWSTDGVFAGEYRIQARLRTLSGTLVRDIERRVTVRSHASLVMTVRPDQAEVQLAAPLAGQIAVDYLAGNRLLLDAMLHVRLLDEGGNERSSQQHVIGSLLPGDRLVRAYGFSGAGLAPGLYQVIAELREGTFLAQAAAGVRVLPTQGSAAVIGTLQLPSHAVPLGDALVIGYTVENRGNVDISGLPLRIQVLPAPLGAPLVQDAVQVDLPVGQVWQGTLAIPATALRHGQFLVVLDRNDSVPAQRLAIGSFGTVDATPPAVAIRAPASGAMTTGAFDVDVRASDSHSAVTAVHVRVGDGPWLALGQGTQASSQFLRHLSGLADGVVTLQAMAEDAAGNQALSEPVTVNVDATAPTIAIDGVQHGIAYNQPVSPLVEIVDAHLASSHIVLNDRVFVSGSTVASEGAHRLFATAIDQAGNRSNLEIAFDIDMTLPTVAFTHPADGASVGTAQIDVLGLTEALADVVLTIDGQAFQTVAASDGAFAFEDVPLAVGANTVSAHAIDRAGNVGVPGDLRIHRIDGGAGTVTGALLLDTASVAHGQPITGSRRVELVDGTAMNALPIRLRLLRGSDGVEVVLQPDFVDLSPGVPDTASFSFESGMLAAQAYRLSLDAELDDGSGTVTWVQLDQVKVDVADQVAPQVQLLQPSPGAVLGSPFAVLVSVQDGLTGVDAVEAQLGEGPWLPLAAVPDPADGFGGDLSAADGPNVLRVRATDGAGNVGYSADHAVAIDTQPPVITLDGVKDGALLNQPVVPVVEVDDAHLDEVDIRLNGQPFTSGTLVDVEGAHELVVHARDVLGQSSSMAVAFTLDFTAPSATILAPADGAQIPLPQVDVRVQSEPYVLLRLQAGSYHAQLPADAEGLATFVAVPLVLGENAILVRAEDGAGNVGADVAISVVRVQPGDAKLAGRLSALPVSLTPDDPVSGVWHIDNIGDADSGPTEVRVRLRVDGSTLTEAHWLTSIAPGQSYDAPFLFADGSWPVGSVAVELHARPQSPDGRPWLLLAHGTIPVVQTGAPQLRWLYPEPGSTVPQRFEIAVQLVGTSIVPTNVEFRFEGGEWRSMVAGAEVGRYEQAVRLRQVWWHRFHVRAWNGAALLAELEGIRLCVDLERLFAHDFERDDRLFRNGFDLQPCPLPLPLAAFEPDPPRPSPDPKRVWVEMIDTRRHLVIEGDMRLTQGGV